MPSAFDPMFYWRIKNHEIVLTDQEESGLVRKLSTTSTLEQTTAWIKYNTNKNARRDLEKRIFSYLESYFNNNYEEFCRRYYYRDVEGEEAVAMLSLLLDGYGRINRLATTGKCLKRGMRRDYFIDSDQRTHSFSPIIETLSDAEVYWITLFQHRTFSWLPLKPLAYLSFPLQTIIRVVGTVQSFDLHTSTAVVRFQPTLVEVNQGSSSPTNP